MGIHTPWTGPELTPEKITEYLGNKPKYLAMWKQLVPDTFGKNQFCDYFNTMKDQLHINKTIPWIQALDKRIADLSQKKPLSTGEKQQLLELRKQKNDIYYATINESFQLSRHDAIRIKEIFYPLIGSLLNIFKTKEQTETLAGFVNKDVAKVNVQKNVEEIKYLWVLLKSAIGERYYKEFVSDFFKQIKECEDVWLQNVVDIVYGLIKTYNINTTEDTMNDVIDYLERMRSISNKKRLIDRK